MPTQQNEPDESRTVKVVAEQLEVHREIAETGAVRVRIRTAQRSEILDEALVRRGMNVERVPCNLPVSERTAPWYDGEVMVVPVYEEVIVRQLVMKEQLRLTPTATVEPQAIAVELATETPVFERRDEHGNWHEVPLG
jgi:stress response protein YsnF